MKSVGQDVDSWCTRCKLMLAHTVEAVIGNKITRVHCNTCRSQHAYRPQQPGERVGDDRRPPSTAMRPARATTTSRSDDYATLLNGRDAASARGYSPQERFALNDLIAHPTFGLGVVRTLKDRTKIDVLFRDGVKTLLHRF